MVGIVTLKSSAARVAEGDELEIDYSERAGFLVGKAAALAEWRHKKDQADFAKLTNRLKVAKWQRENPEKRRRNALAYWYRHRDELLVPQRVQQRLKRAAHWKPDTTVYTCKGCKTQWCRLIPKPAGGDLSKRGTGGPTPPPLFCTPLCRRKWLWQQQKQDPVALEAKRQRARDHYKRKESQANRLLRR